MSLLVLMGLVACGGAQVKVQDNTPMSVEDHAVAANGHDQLAQAHEQQAAEATAASSSATYDCGDTVMADQVTSGGERLVNMVPCFNVDDESAAQQRSLAAKEHAAAEHDRAVADRMLAAEAQSCAAIAPRELDHTVFTHRRDIAEVTPYVQDGKVEGARIHFKAVRHLNADWLKASIACHEAQFIASGKDPKLMAYDPTLVDGAKVIVDMRKDGGIEVTISAANDTAAAVILGRSQDLVAPPTAAASR